MRGAPKASRTDKPTSPHSATDASAFAASQPSSRRPFTMCSTKVGTKTDVSTPAATSSNTMFGAVLAV
jgi:hypothetical protein